MSRLALGLDLGSSGLRLALAEATPEGDLRLLHEESSAYPRRFADPRGWREGLIALVSELDPQLRSRVQAIAIAGTSGTLLRCHPDGEPLPGESGLALPYHLSCPEQAETARRLCGDPCSPAASASGSLARALRLIANGGNLAEEAVTGAMPPATDSPAASQGGRPGKQASDDGGACPSARRSGKEAIQQRLSAECAGMAKDRGSRSPWRAAGLIATDPARQTQAAVPPRFHDFPGGEAPSFLLRHQADWLMGWLLGDWRWGEEGNNLRLGWDLQRQAWSGTIASQAWASALPQICGSGCELGSLSPRAAVELDLPADCRVIAGSTDANAGVLAADPQEGDGITVVGTTLVLKQFVDAPINASGVSCHRVGGRWLLGGASNAGAGILRRFYSDAQIAELSRQIDPHRPAGLELRPLPARGERFPVDDPLLEPRLEPRPVSDALYLQALLEGLTEIERQGWQRFAELGAPPLRRVISLGGGARNPQWRLLRQQVLGVPVLQRPGLSAALGMARLAIKAAGRMESSADGQR